jgi:uncharacterized membrane protein YbhN (UPF0104 family)
MKRTPRQWLGILAPLLLLGGLAWRLGTGPLITGLGAVNVTLVVVAVPLAGLTTVCCAWRWSVVAHRLGVGLPLGTAVAAYYRSLFLNLTVPGGVVGDVHRGLTHGREVADMGRAMRAVGSERVAGQCVQALITLPVLLILPSPVRPVMPWVTGALVGAVALLALICRLAGGGPDSTRARGRRAVSGELRRALLARDAWPQITLASTLVVAGHTVTFVLAARAAGSTAPLTRLLPIALLTLAAMVLPSAGGWGPREGVAAWAFAAAGLGLDQGLTTAVIYGVLGLIAALPGALVLALDWRRGARTAATAASAATAAAAWMSWPSTPTRRRAAHV